MPTAANKIHRPWRELPTVASFSGRTTAFQCASVAGYCSASPACTALRSASAAAGETPGLRRATVV
jgi:hypothetical protein